MSLKTQRHPPAFRIEGAHSLSVFLHAQAITASGAQNDAPDTQALSEALSRSAQILRGLAQYQAHPFQRHICGKATLWRKGSTRILDFGGSGPPVLVIPSLVNGPEIMDLSESLSPLRWLAAQGFRVFQVDWGAPGPAEHGFDLGGYLKERLIPALGAVSHITESPVHLIGYCMGGPLMLALAQHRQDLTAKIVTLGAPWDFSAFPEHAAMQAKQAEVAGLLNSLDMMFGVIPAQITRSFFALRDIGSSAAKFHGFAALDPVSEAAKRFVAVEDWLNNGIALTVPVGRECFLGWVAGDTLRKGLWTPGGKTFSPENISAPALVVTAQKDTVVRRTAAEPLTKALQAVTPLSADTGHIGMIVGDKAIQSVWRPIADFLHI